MPDVHVICGPAGSGKTERLLERYRVVARQSDGAALWIGPTIRYVLALRQRLGAQEAGALAPRVLTFQDFVEEIIRCNDPPARPLTHVQRRLLGDDLVADLFRRGHLSHFRAVIDTRGFAEAVFALLAQLKQQEIWSERFADAVTRLAAETRVEPSSLRKAEQCAHLYRAYQDHLTRHQLYDLEGRFWRARDLLTRGAREPFAYVRAIFVDGFTEFTHTQHEILECLSRSVDDVWIAVLSEPGHERSELFERPRTTLQRLAQPQPRIEELPRLPATNGLAHLERELFRPLRSVERLSRAEDILILEGAGMLGEARLVARRVKSLLLAAVPPDDIQVTLRDLVPYVNLLREVFAEYEIPVDVEGTDSLWRCPAVATLLRSSRLPEEDWRFTAVTALLRNEYFRPDWPSTRGCPEIVRQSEILLRLLGEPRGRDAYLRAVQVWAENPPPRWEDEDADEPRRRMTQDLAKRCRGFLQQFFHAWDDKPERGTLEEHIGWLRHLAEALGIARVADEDPHDRAALARLWDELERWQALDQTFHGGTRVVERASFYRMLVALTAEAGLARTPRGSGRVRILSANYARNLSAPYVFVMGLCEGSFPQLVPPEPLFDESERQAFRKVGLPFPCLSEQMPEEMLLFYQLVTSARQQLVLSYPAVDEKGQELLPSSFLEKLRDCFERDALPVVRRRMLIEGYDRDAPLSAAELRVQQAANGRTVSDCPKREGEAPAEPSDRSFSQDLRLGRSLALPTNDLSPTLAAAAEVARERFGREHGVYDGLLQDPRVIAEIDQRFGPRHTFSPTALENYIACPFRFFLGHVLKLQPLDEPREEIEGTDRGTTFHRALARLHEELKAAGVHLPAPEVDASMQRRLDETVGEAVERASPAAKVLWQIEGQRLRRPAARYRAHWERFVASWLPRGVQPRPEWFEVSFGLPDAQGKILNRPLVIVADGIEVHISGRIDRVDVAELPDDAGIGFWIIDYKTGHSTYYTGSDLKAFRRLQLTLYAMAVEQVLLVGTQARPLGLAYWLVTDTGPKVALPAYPKPLAWFEEAEAWRLIRAELERWVVTLVRKIRQGAFPLKPRAEESCEMCHFAQICRISQTRRVVARKTWELPLPGE